MKSVLILIACAAIAVATVSYNKYKVFQVHPKNEEELAILKDLSSRSFYDFWSAPNNVDLPTTVMVSPDHIKSFSGALKIANIHFKVLIDNVKRSVSAERTRQHSISRLDKGKIYFDEYNRYHTIQDYLLKVAEEYPDIVSLQEIGYSYENRTMRMIKIGAGGITKPVILVDGGIHAREWISPAFVTYLIRELVENEDNRHMIETTNWYIIPVLNPDGYEYTHTEERFWRKTRSVGDRCYGVDGNRNFGYHWMEVGASDRECTDTYAGPVAFSEPETSALKEVVNKYKESIKLYLTFHSYGNYILYPWGFTSDLPDDVDELHALATDVDDAIASVSGTRYTIGSSTNVLYAAAGGSDDWVKGVGGVQLGYTIELTGGGDWGFDLPASEILNVCIETFEGMRVFQSYIAKKFPKVCREKIHNSE